MSRAITEIPQIPTERLLLRAFRSEDLDQYALICGDPEVMRYVGEGKPLSRADAWRQMALSLGHWPLPGFGMWAVEEKQSNAVIGRIGFWQPEGWPGFELGWILGRQWWGKGYATEGASVALHFAFTELGREHVISLMRRDNHASIRLAKRLGETLEGETELFGSSVQIYGIRRSSG